MYKFFVLKGVVLSLVLLLKGVFPVFSQGYFTDIPILNEMPVNFILEGKEGTLLVAAEDGLFRISKNADTHVYTKECLLKSPVSAITFDTEGQILAGTYENHVFIINPTSKQRSFEFEPIGKNVITSLQQDSKQFVWASTFGSGVWKFKRGSGNNLYEYVEIPESFRQINDMLIDSQDTKWLASEGGLYQILSSGMQNSFKDIIFASALKLHNNTLYVAGSNRKNQATLWMFKDMSEWISVQLPAAVSQSRITGMDFDGLGRLWIAGSQIACWDFKKWSFYGKDKGFTSLSPLCLFIDSEENVWVGTAGKGLLALLRERKDTSKEMSLKNLLNADYYEPELFTGSFQLQLQFERSEAILSESYFEDLDDLGDILIKFPSLRILISGHTDNVGNHLLNMKLSQDRAETVKKYLCETKNIDPERIKTRGFGGTRPIVTQVSEEEREKNRRVEVIFFEE